MGTGSSGAVRPASGRGGALARIAAKVDLLRRVEAAHGFGVVIEEPANALEPIPEAPDGLVEVFSLFHRLEGSYFRFVQPPEIDSAAAWAGRELCATDDLMGYPLTIGYEIRDIPVDLVAERNLGPPIRLDVETGSVYFIDTDEYIYYVKGMPGEIEVEEFAPDVVTFFDECVLGAGYPEFVREMCGPAALDHRVRRGRFKGQYTDTWRRLLTAAGLAS
ncbi:hypothetical protein V1634_16075 [Plantactinospora veratri]|uniref:SMI1/KNR4 family protein n=1 Tax=Plantactinospora veratri TaxID=1436122 RepID=A0ABU7SEH1_9ACTN